jgi:hypothetical protein
MTMTGPRPRRVSPVRFVRQNPSAGLLLLQLLGILLYPWMEASPRGRAAFGAFGLLILGVALRVVRRSPWLTWLGLALASLVVLLAGIHVVVPHPVLPIAIAMVASAFYFYATGSLIAYMLQDWEATTDELFAAGATFTLLAWAFAHAYAACQAMAWASIPSTACPRSSRSRRGRSSPSYTLLTRDRRGYKTYYPKLKLIEP